MKVCVMEAAGRPRPCRRSKSPSKSETLRAVRSRAVRHRLDARASTHEQVIAFAEQLPRQLGALPEPVMILYSTMFAYMLTTLHTHVQKLSLPSQFLQAS